MELKPTFNMKASSTLYTSLVKTTQTLNNYSEVAYELRDNYADEMRSNYLEIFDKCENDRNITTNWKDEFKMIAENIKKVNIQNLEEIDEPPQNYSITIYQNGKTYTFEDKDMIICGKKTGCDICMKGYGTSRLHFILIPLPRYGVVMVCDMGSFYGIQTKERSSGQTLINSYPNQRNVLLFDWNESFILFCGGSEITIKPKECIVCFEKSREIVLKCGHNLMCRSCFKKMSKNGKIICPICRQKSKHGKFSQFLKTNVGVSLFKSLKC